MLEVDIKKRLPGFTLEVAFSVNREILSILGRSGSGKTMTLLSIAGLLCPDEGYIKLNGNVLFDSAKKICLPAQKRNIGFVFQNYALFPHLTVRENIAYGIRHLPKQEIQEKTCQLLSLIHIPDLGHRYPNELSSGQQQRVALARAIAPSPGVLLLDEPFSALDALRKEQLEYELLSLQQVYSGDIIFVTHDLAQGYKLGSKMAVYEAGRIVQCDAKQKVVYSPINRSVARLIGVRNLVDGKVTKIADNHVWVKIDSVCAELKVITEESSQYAVGQEVIIGIRPECVRICQNNEENTVVCMLERYIEGVDINHVRFNTCKDGSGGYLIDANIPTGMMPQLSAGHECKLYLPPEHLIILNR
ncbi:MAG: ABC transporter ATP-binding protein [Dehalococcoidales bacterium]